MSQEPYALESPEDYLLPFEPDDRSPETESRSSYQPSSPGNLPLTVPDFETTPNPIEETPATLTEPDTTTNNRAENDIYQASRDINSHRYEGDNYFGLGPSDIKEIAELLRKGSKQPVLHDPTVLASSMESVVGPPDQGQQIECLRNEHIIFLHAERHRGLETAAINLAYQFSRDISDSASDISEVYPDVENDLLSALTERPPNSITIAAMGESKAAIEECRTSMSHIQSMLRSAGRYLIITVDTRYSGHCRHFAERFLFELKRPDSHQVFSTRLQNLPTAMVEKLLADERFKQKLNTLWPPAIASLAMTISWQFSAGDDDIDSLAAILTEQTGQRHQALREALDERPKSSTNDQDIRAAGETAVSRATLISAALFEGSDCSFIYSMAEKLQEATELEIERLHPLERSSVISQIKEMPWAESLKFDVDTGRFIYPQLSDMVLPQVWNEYPGLRTGIATWLRWLITARHGQTETAQLIRSSISLASAIQNPQLLEDLLRALLPRNEESDGEPSRGGIARYRLKLAAQLLVTASFDKRIGKSIRELIYRYADSQGSPNRQALAMIVCTDNEFLRRFPNVALTRLRFLSRSRFEAVRDGLVVAMPEVAGHFSCAAILTRLSTWLKDQKTPGQRLTVVEIHNELFRDDDFSSRFEDEVSEALGLGTITAYYDFWESLFRHGEWHDSIPPLRAWVTCAARVEPNVTSLMQEMLATTVGHDVKLFGYLTAAIGRIDPALSEVESQIAKGVIDRALMLLPGGESS